MLNQFNLCPNIIKLICSQPILFVGVNPKYNAYAYFQFIWRVDVLHDSFFKYPMDKDINVLKKICPWLSKCFHVSDLQKGKILSWALGYWDPDSLGAVKANLRGHLGNLWSSHDMKCIGVNSSLLPCIYIWTFRFPKRGLLNSLEKEMNYSINILFSFTSKPSPGPLQPHPSGYFTYMGMWPQPGQGQGLC